MIRLCTCTGGSSSSLVNQKYIEGSKTCTSCGGKLSLDGRGALPRSMLNTIGLELSRVVDPHLNWKTASKGKQRAVRRARTSFSGGNKNRTPKSSEDSEDLTDKDSKRTSDMAVSEFEKLGVNILGRRFGDTLASVPIKKRRHLLVRSPSPPHQSSSQLDDSDQIRETQYATYEEATSNATDQSRSFVEEKTNLVDLNEKLCDSADFSGISILAAAACDSNVGGDVINGENSNSRELKSEEKEEQIYIKQLSVGETETAPETSTKLVMAGEESEETKVDGSCNLDTSMTCSIKVPDKTTRVESSSRDDRLHWDLNTEMDAWEGHSDDILKSEPLDTNSIAGVHNEKLGDVGPQIGSADSKCASENNNCRNSDHKEENACFFPLHEDSPAQEDHDLEVAPVSMVDAAGEANTLHDQEKTFLTTRVPSPVKGGPAPAWDSSLVTAICGEKRDACSAGFGSVVQTKISEPPLVHCENASCGHTHSSTPHTVTGQIPNIVHEGNELATSAAPLVEHFVQCSHCDVHIGQTTEPRSPQVEKHASVHADLRNGMEDPCSVANCLAERTSGVMEHENICKNMTDTSVTSVEIAHTNAIVETTCCSSGKFKEGSMSPFTFESRAFCTQGLSSHDELSSEGAQAGEHETTDADMKVTEDDSYVHSNSEVVACNSTIVKPGMVAVPSLNGALNSDGVPKSIADVYGTSTGQVALEDQSDCDYYSDASHTDQPTGMEKVEFLGDEDYQYEDGEFRESFVNTWGEDGAEDGETEYVDYGSDNGEADIFEDASDFHASVSLPVDHIEGKSGPSDANCDVKYGAQAGKETQDTVSPPFMKCSSDDGSAKSRTEDGSRKLERDAEDALVSGGVSTEVTEVKEYLIKGVASRESSHLASFRVKASGWDRLPEGCRGSESGVVVSGVDPGSITTDASLGTSNSGEPFRRVVGSSPRRDLSSRVERLKSSDASRRTDNKYDRANSPKEHSNLDSRADRDRDPSRSFGRGAASLHMLGRGKQNQWIDSAASFTHSTSKNAAAATIAKLESNGFVIAADGTIFKAGGGRPASQVPTRSTKELSHSVHHSAMGRRSLILRDVALGKPGVGNSREMSPDRHISIEHARVASGRCGPGMASTGDRERYHGSLPDGRPLHRSHTRSPLRSRTRSPHMHTPTQGRNDHGMNEGPGLRLHSRSPQFKSEVRTQRYMSHYQSDLVEHTVGCTPSSRNHTSPPHAPRYVDGRKGIHDHFRGYEPGQYSGRSRPSRVFLQNKRFPEHSETFPEFDDFDRGYDGPGEERRGCTGEDRRGFDNRYEMLRPVRRYDTDGNMKHFRYDAEDGFGVHNARPRSSEFQRRATPRGFDRGVENQLGNSPKRVKEEKVDVRYVRDGKHNAGFKSLGVRDHDDPMTQRRRRPL